MSSRSRRKRKQTPAQALATSELQLPHGWRLPRSQPAIQVWHERTGGVLTFDTSHDYARAGDALLGALEHAGAELGEVLRTEEGECDEGRFAKISLRHYPTEPVRHVWIVVREDHRGYQLPGLPPANEPALEEVQRIVFTAGPPACDAPRRSPSP
ncbi:MAG TPA: hypothetical protein VNO21_06800, partial [Polyangiaceae bacterium]|nr:hypothetical protein [Polyangiaceae bacterium]